MNRCKNISSREELGVFNREYQLEGDSLQSMDWKRFKIMHRSNPDQICYPVTGKNGRSCTGAVRKDTNS